MEEIYYKKILLSSGEMPEKSGMYHTSSGYISYGIPLSSKSINLCFKVYNVVTEKDEEAFPEYWLKPVSLPSPKQEAVEFGQSLCLNYTPTPAGKKWFPVNYDKKKGTRSFFTSELYDKFKEDQMWSSLKDFPNKAF